MTGPRHLDRLLKLHHFRAADSIAAHHSLLKAAAALAITQPALSKALGEAERIVGRRLFDRLPRGMRVTAAGETFVDCARRVLAELKRLDEALDALSGPDSGALAIGVLPVAAAGVLPVALARLKAEKPGINVRLEQGRTEDLLPLLAAGAIDLVVGRLYEPPAPDAFAREALWSEPLSILARTDHPLFSRAHLEVADLKAFELVLPTISQRVGQEIAHLLQRLGLSAAATTRSSSYGFIRETLLSGDALSVMPRLMMVGDLMRGALRIVPLPMPAARRPAGLILPRDRPLPPVGRAFVAGLRATIRDLAERGHLDITDGDG